MKYSFIVPVYNGEKYIDRCLKSLLNQTYKNYEIVVINDGSADNSIDILTKYEKDYKNVVLLNIKNKGVSNARNLGVSKISGDYFIFVDIDDYVDINMLDEINKIIRTRDTDLLKYNYYKITNDAVKVNDSNSFEVLTGEGAFINFVNKKVPFDLTCIYTYKSEFFKKNNFQFEVGKYHEDFGLIPYVILKSNIVINLDKTLYYYVQSENSITRTDDEEKLERKFQDILFHFDNLYKKVNNDNNIVNKNIFNSYIANAVILNYMKLPSKYKKIYKNEIKKRKVADLLLNNTFFRIIKRIIYKIMI